MKLCGLLFFVFLSHCKVDHFSFSRRDDSHELGTRPSYRETENLIYCNKFHTNGFQGILTAYYDLGAKDWDRNKAQLYLWKVPVEWTYPPTNYIQLYAFRIEDGREIFSPTPVNINLIINATKDTSLTITALDHHLLKEKGGLSIDKFLKSHVFILEDVGGWQGLALSVFNEENKSVKTARVLLPPFPAEPQVYLRKNNNEKLLLKQHPFGNLFHAEEEAHTFYKKGLDFCKKVSLDFEVPTFSESSGPANLDQLIDEFSFLPDW